MEDRSNRGEGRAPDVKWIDAWDVLLAGFAFAAILAYGRISLALSYWSGLTIDPDVLGYSLMLGAAIAVLPYTLGAIIVLRLIVKSGFRKGARWCIRAALAGAVFVGGFVCFLERPPGWEEWVRGLEDGLRSRVDVTQARAWAAEHPGFTSKTSLQKLPRGRVTVSDNGKSLNIYWGGGFVPRWGLAVAPTDMSASQCGTAGRIIQLERGAWLWVAD